MATFTSVLVRRAERQACTPTALDALATMGAAVDAGVIDLDDLLDQVSACQDAAELGELLARLAAGAEPEAVTPC